MTDAHLLGVCFFASLLLLDIPEFTDRFAILESICFLLSNSYRALRFCRFAREGGCILGHVVVVEFVGFGGFGFFL